MLEFLYFCLGGLQFLHDLFFVDGLEFPKRERIWVLISHSFDEDFPSLELLEILHADAFLEQDFGKVSPFANCIQSTQISLISQHAACQPRPFATYHQVSRFDRIPLPGFYTVD